MDYNQSLALKEFNEITETCRIQIPEDIEIVSNKLNMIGVLLTASEWARSAIVRAWVESKQGKRSDLGENSSKLTISDFANLEIQGLSTRDAVRHYYNAWNLTKLPTPQRGKIVSLPQIPFPEWDTSHALVSKFTGEQENYTPAEIIGLVKQVMGDIDLDPASTKFAQRIVQAKKYFTQNDDGLSKPWFGRVFLNPPYQMPKIKQFTDKLIEELANIETAILLTNNNTDTSWFHKCAQNSNLICFTKGRINFYKIDKERTHPTNGQSFFYFGNKETKFLEIFSKYGLIVKVENV